MRTVLYGAACSLDGFIAAADGALDWLHFSADAAGEMRRSFAGVDTIVMGRKTWEAGLALSGGKHPYPGHRTLVFSRTLPPSAGGDVEVVAADAAEVVRDLRQGLGGTICVMGGGELARALFAADLVDEVGLNVHPVLLGAGVPLFRDAGRRVPLALVRTRAMDGGCVLLSYAVQR